MDINVTLVQPLSANDQTISLSSGPLEVGTDLIVGGTEHCTVQKVLSPTQARVVRGAHSTTATDHPRWTLVKVAVESVEAFDQVRLAQRPRERHSPIVLAQPLGKTDTVITVSGGSLVPAARLGIEDEWCEVKSMLTASQAVIQRGMEGTMPVEHDGGTPVEVILPPAPRSSGRTAPVISGTTKLGACPLCGCTGDHAT